MATDYTLDLKAKLDTSEVKTKLEDIGEGGGKQFGELEKAVKDLDSALKQAIGSLKELGRAGSATSLKPPSPPPAPPVAPATPESTVPFPEEPDPSIEYRRRLRQAEAARAAAKFRQRGTRSIYSQWLDRLGDYALAEGAGSVGFLSRIGARGLQGAPMGAQAATMLGFTGPQGLAIGAILGAAVPVFQQMLAATKSTSEALAELSDSAKRLRAEMGERASEVGKSRRVSEISTAYDEVAQLEAQRKQELKTIQQYEAALAAQKYDLTKVVAGVDAEKPKPVDIEVNEPKPVDIEVDVDAAGEQKLEDLKKAADKARESLSKIDFAIRESEAAATAGLNARREELQKRIDEYEKYATGEVDFGEMSEDERLKKYGTANLLANYQSGWRGLFGKDGFATAKDIEKSVEKSTYDNRKATLEALKEQAEAAQREIAAIDQTIQQRQKQAEAAKMEAAAGVKAAAAADEMAEAIRRKEAEIKQRQAEAVTDTAAKQLSQFTRSLGLEQFRKSLSDMKPQELKDVVTSLKSQRSEAMTKYAVQLKKAETTGSAEDFAVAQGLGDQFNDITAKLKDSESALERVSKLKPDDGVSSFGELMATATATSTLGQKGYDVGGYGQFNTVQQQALAQSVQQTQKIAEQTVQTKTLSNTATQIYNLLMRQLMQNGSLAGNISTWG